MTLDLFRKRALECLGRAGKFCCGPIPPVPSSANFQGEAVIGTVREAAEALCHRASVAVLWYPVLVLIFIITVPETRSRLSFPLLCLFLLLVSAGARLRIASLLARQYAIDSLRWWRVFRLSLYAPVLVWDVFAIHEMNAAGETWPTWMTLLMTAGISAGATTSLCADPPLLRRFLLLVLGPHVLWGLAHGGPCGTAIAVALTSFLVFIQVQAHHTSQAFWLLALDKEALRQSSRRLDCLVNSIEGIVWESDRDRGRFTFVSAWAESILGYAVKSWLSEPSFWTKHMHPDDRDTAVQYSKSASAAGRDHTLEYRMRAADGRTVWLRDIVSIAKNEASEKALRGIMLDVTAQKQASEEQNLQAHALRTVSEAVVITDLEGRIVFVNDSFLSLYGYTRDEVLSKHTAMLRSVKNPRELGAVIAEGTNRGGWQGEVWNRRRDGQEFPIALSTALVRNEFGRTVAKIGVASDITSRKRTEDELRHAKEIADAANRAKSEFLANMSHDIRTPLNGVIGMNQLLLRTELDQRQRRYGETIRDSASSLSAVLNDILDFSKIEAGKLTLESTDFDLRQILESISDLFAVPAQEKGLEFCCFIEPRVPTALRGDPARLRQVVVNLVGNAVKFTRAGSIDILVRLEADGPRLRFEVSDTGIGMSRADQKKLFQPFSQVESSTTRCFGGTGLGLSIVHRLVTLMGGTVGVESEEGKGSKFWFTSTFERQVAVRRPEMLSLRGHRVLVLESQPAGRRLLRNLLGLWNCEFKEASSIESGVAQIHAAQKPFEAVIVNAHMPGVSRSWNPGVPVIALVPLVHIGEVRGTSRPDFVAQVTKPVKQGELGTVLANVLGYTRRPGPNESARRDDRESLFASRANFRILVVEDNLTNQEVAKGMLAELGCRSVKLVSKGSEAIEALQGADFDLVLMDCQLPDVDGYEVTALIRHEASPVRNHRVPVVAMTAHAMDGDRMKCLDAGMDDYLAKPIKMELLDQMLSKWLIRASGDQTNEMCNPVLAEGAPKPEATGAVFDQDDLLDRLMGNEELACRVVSRFLTEMPQQLASLADAIDRADAEGVKRTAHSIKGAAGNAAGMQLYGLARQIELSGKEGDCDRARELLKEITRNWDLYREKAVQLSYVDNRG